MPLSSHGLCEAEITTPASKPCAPARNATAGVGTTPALSTHAPVQRKPAAIVAAIHGLDSRVSRPRMTLGSPVFLRREWPSASPVAKIVVGSKGGSPATARIPSVPNNLRAVDMLIVSLLCFALLRCRGRTGLFYAAHKRSVAQSCSNPVTLRELRSRSNQCAISTLHKRIAAVEHGERRKCVQSPIHRMQAGPISAENTLQRALEAQAALRQG